VVVGDEPDSKHVDPAVAPASGIPAAAAEAERAKAADRKKKFEADELVLQTEANLKLAKLAQQKVNPPRKIFGYF